MILLDIYIITIFVSLFLIVWYLNSKNFINAFYRIKTRHIKLKSKIPIVLIMLSFMPFFNWFYILYYIYSIISSNDIFVDVLLNTINKKLHDDEEE